MPQNEHIELHQKRCAAARDARASAACRKHVALQLGCRHAGRGAAVRTRQHARDAARLGARWRHAPCLAAAASRRGCDGRHCLRSVLTARRGACAHRVRVAAMATAWTTSSASARRRRARPRSSPPWRGRCAFACAAAAVRLIVPRALMALDCPAALCALTACALLRLHRTCSFAIFCARAAHWPEGEDLRQEAPRGEGDDEEDDCGAQRARQPPQGGGGAQGCRAALPAGPRAGAWRAATARALASVAAPGPCVPPRAVSLCAARRAAARSARSGIRTHTLEFCFSEAPSGAMRNPRT